MRRLSTWVCLGTVLLIVSVLVGCAGNSPASSNSTTTTTTTTSSSSNPAKPGSVDIIVSDDPAADWATIGVKVLSIALVPQGGGSNVVVYTAPNPAPVINLVQLDQIGDLISSASIPAGTYTGAVVTIGANPGDIMLTAAADPENGFACAPGTTVGSNQIQVQHAQGPAGNLTTTVQLTLETPLVVTANQSTQVNLDFDLSHPAFLIDHTPAGAGTTFWAVNFNGPLRHKPIRNLASFLLRDLYATVTSVASDNKSIVVARVFATRPATNPETAVTSNITRTILADAVNGTIFYDVDAKTRTTITDFASLAGSLTGKYVRIAARYQVDGSLVAVRIWASSSFNSLWVSPEGHVLHVNKTANTITVDNENGRGVPIVVNDQTQFFYRMPSNPSADSQPIGTGTSFLASGNIVRGFKVHVTVVDPLASPLVAQTVEIEVAKYQGAISSANSSSFVYTSRFPAVIDNYTYTENYNSSFNWWFFTFPTQSSTDVNAFVSTVNGAANFGGTVGILPVFGVSGNTWNTSSSSWAAVNTILEPAPVPRGTVSTAWSATNSGGTFAMTVEGGTNAVTVTASNVSGSATLVYQIDRTNGVMTVSPVDLTTSAGQAAIAQNLTVGTPVKTIGVPQADGSIKAYALYYYTGMMPK